MKIFTFITQLSLVTAALAAPAAVNNKHRPHEGNGNDGLVGVGVGIGARAERTGFDTGSFHVASPMSYSMYG